MRINDADNKDKSLYHYALFLLGISETDTTTFPISQFIRSANARYREAVFWIWQYSSIWEFDDSNYNDLPIATTSLVDGQQDYSIPTDALDVLRVEVLDSDGNYQLIPQIDKSQITSALTEYEETAGLPDSYDLIGGSIFLYPKPGSGYVTLADGLKLYLARDIDAFTTSDTTQEPGFMSSFHEIIAYGSAYDFALANGINDKILILRPEIDRIKVAMEQYYSQRSKDFERKISPRVKSSI